MLVNLAHARRCRVTVAPLARYRRHAEAIEAESVPGLIGNNNGLADRDCVVAGEIINVECGGSRV